MVKKIRIVKVLKLVTVSDRESKLEIYGEFPDRES